MANKDAVQYKVLRYIRCSADAAVHTQPHHQLLLARLDPLGSALSSEPSASTPAARLLPLLPAGLPLVTLRALSPLSPLPFGSLRALVSLGGGLTVLAYAGSTPAAPAVPAAVGPAASPSSSSCNRPPARNPSSNRTPFMPPPTCTAPPKATTPPQGAPTPPAASCHDPPPSKDHSLPSSPCQPPPSPGPRRTAVKPGTTTTGSARPAAASRRRRCSSAARAAASAARNSASGGSRARPSARSQPALACLCAALSAAPPSCGVVGWVSSRGDGMRGSGCGDDILTTDGEDGECGGVTGRLTSFVHYAHTHAHTSTHTHANWLNLPSSGDNLILPCPIQFCHAPHASPCSPAAPGPLVQMSQRRPLTETLAPLQLLPPRQWSTSPAAGAHTPLLSAPIRTPEPVGLFSSGMVLFACYCPGCRMDS